MHLDLHNDKKDDHQKPSDRRLKYKLQQLPDQDVRSLNNVQELTNNDKSHNPSIPAIEDSQTNGSTTESSTTISSLQLNFSIRLNETSPIHWSTDGKQVISVSLHPTSGEYRHVQDLYQTGLDKINIVQVYTQY